MSTRSGGGEPVVRGHERGEVRRDVHAEQAAGVEGLLLALGQRHDLLEFVNGVEAVRKLPPPVVPFLVRDASPNGRAAGGLEKVSVGHGSLLRLEVRGWKLKVGEIRKGGRGRCGRSQRRAGGCSRK